LPEQKPKHLRPFHKEFLDFVREKFEVFIWTRSEGYAARQKCAWLGIDLATIPLVSGWDSMDEYYNKALYELWRQADQVVLIDDDKLHLFTNPRSQIVITAWRGDENDQELKHLIPVLQAIAEAKTVQEVLDLHLACQRQGESPKAEE